MQFFVVVVVVIVTFSCKQIYNKLTWCRFVAAVAKSL